MLLDIFLEFVLDVFYFLFMKYLIYKKIERINIDINKLQNKDIEFNRRIEYFIDKLNKVNDSIKEKV